MKRDNYFVYLTDLDTKLGHRQSTDQKGIEWVQRDEEVVWVAECYVLIDGDQTFAIVNTLIGDDFTQPIKAHMEWEVGFIQDNMI